MTATNSANKKRDFKTGARKVTVAEVAFMASGFTAGHARMLAFAI